jgi:hypothetical protein
MHVTYDVILQNSCVALKLSKHEGKFPNLTLLFHDEICGLPCLAEGNPPHVLITPNEPLPTNTYQAHFCVIAPLICTLNMATTIEKQKR